MPGLTGFLIGSIITAVALFFMLGAFALEAEEIAYKKGLADGRKTNRSEQCEFNKCQHYLTCGKDKGVVCEDFAACKTYMDAYDNDLALWQELHGWEDEDIYE